MTDAPPIHPPLPAALIFDLDGTLWDTTHACASSWNAVLARLGLTYRRMVTADDVRRVTGRSHEQCIRDTFIGFSELQIQQLSSETAIEDNRAIERHGGEVYPGVIDGVRHLARHYPLFIVSNCQAGYIELFLRQSQLAECFRDHECWGRTGRSKTENLRALLERNQLTQAWFIGDALSDHEAARACGLNFAHAAYGFGQCPDADLRLAEFADLVRALECT